MTTVFTRLLTLLRYYVLPFYIVVIMCLYLFQDKIIFQANALSQDFRFHFEDEFTEEFITVEDGTEVSTLFFPADGPSKGLVFYCHGNRRNLKTWGRFVGDFTKHGYDVLLWDYRGFGKTKGKPSQENLFSDGLFLYNKMIGKYGADSIVLYGRSLGSGVATYLASKTNPSQLVLETPYYHMADVGRRHFPLIPYNWLIKHPFRTDQYITKVTSPIHLFHGTEDELIPYSSSIDLAKLLGLKPSEVITTIEGGHHRDLGKFDSYQEKLGELLKK